MEIALALIRIENIQDAGLQIVVVLHDIARLGSRTKIYMLEMSEESRFQI